MLKRKKAYGLAVVGATGEIVCAAPEKNIYPLLIDVAGKDKTHIGRIREDETRANGINLWIVSDNLRKGDALNAVQIAELLIAPAGGRPGN